MSVVLTIAGSDSSGGAGIQADLKTFEAHGLFGASAVTVVTAQNTTGVSGISEIRPDFVKKQIEAVLSDFEVVSIKIGMLYSSEIINAVGEALQEFKGFVVLDPVFISRAGSQLLRDDAIDALKELSRIATIITPNMYEAKRLFGYEIGDSDSLNEIKKSPCPVLVKNHITNRDNKEYSVDILYGGNEKTVFESPLVNGSSTHGTGCSFSSAVAANLAKGNELKEAIYKAKNFIYYAILHAPHIGKGNGPIAHKLGFEAANKTGEEI